MEIFGDFELGMEAHGEWMAELAADEGYQAYVAEQEAEAMASMDRLSPEQYNDWLIGRFDKHAEGCRFCGLLDGHKADCPYNPGPLPF